MAHTDNFTRADENTLSGDYVQDAFGLGTSAMGVNSNAAKPTTTAYGEVAYDGETFGPNSQVTITLTEQVEAEGDWGLSIRVQAPGSSAASGYRVSVFPTTSLVDLNRVDASPADPRTVKLGASVTQAFSVGDRLRLRAEGDTITVLRAPSSTPTEFSEVLSRTDATIADAGYAGFYAYNVGGTGRLDDFEIETLDEAAPIEVQIVTTANRDSRGGAPTSTAFPTATPPAEADLNDLMDEVTSEERSAGATEYWAIGFLNLDETRTAQITVSPSLVPSGYTIRVGGAAEGAGENAEAIATDSTTPTGVTFDAGTVITVPPESFHIVWVERDTPEDQPSSTGNEWALLFEVAPGD